MPLPMPNKKIKDDIVYPNKKPLMTTIEYINILPIINIPKIHNKITKIILFFNEKNKLDM